MNILYSDKDMVVCVKPIGVDSEHGLPSLLSEDLGGDVFTVHRLDLNVGGVMVYARNKATAAALSRAITEGSFIKEYFALVHNIPPQSGDWEDLLFKDKSKNKVFVVTRERKGVKKARLEYTRLTDDGVSPALVRIRLHTGRSHQIRVQFASRGFPLLGDGKYGARDDLTAPRLYSCKLTFPLFGKEYSFESAPDWAKQKLP